MYAAPPPSLSAVETSQHGGRDPDATSDTSEGNHVSGSVAISRPINRILHSSSAKEEIMQKKTSVLFTMLIVFGLLFAPLGGASAQGAGASGKPFPIQRTRPAPAPAAGDKLTNFVVDPSLEASYNNPSGAWAQSSTNFGSPLCTVADCGNGNSTAGPRSGSVWGWFGGVV